MRSVKLARVVEVDARDVFHRIGRNVRVGVRRQSTSISTIDSLCIQARADYLCRGCAGARSAADRRRVWIRNVADRKNHRHARLLFAVNLNKPLLVQLQLLAKQFRIRLNADANQHAPHSQLKRLQSLFSQNLNRLDVIFADDTRQNRFGENRNRVVWLKSLHKLTPRAQFPAAMDQRHGRANLREKQRVLHGRVSAANHANILTGKLIAIASGGFYHPFSL